MVSLADTGAGTIDVSDLADAQPGSFVNVDSGNRGVWCTGNDIDGGGGVYPPFRLYMFYGGVSYRSGLGLDIPHVNVVAVEGADVSGDEHFIGLPGLPRTRGSGTIFSVLGLLSDGRDLWN